MKDRRNARTRKPMKKIAVALFALLVFPGAVFAADAAGKSIDEKLIGRWEGCLLDPLDGERIEPMMLEFTKDGEMVCTLGEGDMQNVIKTTYWTSENVLYVTTPDSREEEKATYEIKGNTLRITNAGVKNKFIKK